ncbi:hypothetical protein [Metabacillus malikii]|uniref:TRAP-type mannitol/chloroaromatic compound transport system permease small subunit n=1 Tax=Metabacillus malikii TaxID=1504265 RepID=A0ABT9ZK16_9BACI|nr:hypothetical protein [Metabacillus malikii]MDQ0232607.1 TRAP-type mannitol/chloroaromatic compound transport system permease small subunit [Metabacillus malikii]
MSIEQGLKIMEWVAFYLMPFFCIVFVLNCVSLAKKIRIGENTAKNTIWITITFLLIIYSIMSVAAMNY